jgi:sulfite exporter TauE/SafE
MLAAISAGFTLGLGVSGSCAVMCMPVLASYVASSEKPTFANGLFTSLLFSLGRLISYTVLAIIFGLIASAFDISQTVKGIAVLILGCLVIIQGLSALGVLNAKIPLGLSLCKYTRNRNSPVILVCSQG